MRSLRAAFLIACLIGVDSNATSAQKIPASTDPAAQARADSVRQAQMDSLDAEMEAYHAVHYPPFGPRFGLTTLGYRYSIPFRSSGYIGAGRVVGFGGGLMQHTGVIVEAGSGGGQLSISHGRANTHIALVYVRGQLTVMRTWGDPHIVDPGETFIGIEGRAGFMLLFGLSLGFMYQVEGDGQRWFVPIGWQIGL